MVEQPTFSRQAPAVTSQVAIRADYAVAWNDDGQLVGAIRLGHGPVSAWLSDCRGHFRIGSGLSRRNLPQSFPHLYLEGRAQQFQRCSEFR